VKVHIGVSEKKKFASK